MKPWTTHMLTVFAAAFAMYGRANPPAATSPSELRSTERLVRTPISASSLFIAADPKSGAILSLSKLTI
jgi:hypothetical protein